MKRVIITLGILFILAAQVGSQTNISQFVPTMTVSSTSSTVAVTASVKASLTTAVVVKASLGNVYGVFALNGAASTCWVQFLNTASSPTLGTNVIFSVPLPGSTTQPVWVFGGPQALSNFSTGISVGIATTSNGSTACGTAGNITVFYQ